VSLAIEVSGVRYEGFVSAKVEARMDALSRSFEFEATSDKGRPLPIRGGEACRIYADGDLVLTGFVEVVDASGSAEDHAISIKGRDRAADLVDSTLGILSDIRPPIDLKTIIRRVLKHLDLGLSVVDQASPEKYNEAEDLAAPEPGKPAFEFLEALSRKRQVLLTSNEDGNVVIAKPSGTKTGASILHRVKSNENNVLSYSVSYDATGRFRVYKTLSQLNVVPLLLAGGVDLGSIVSQGETKTVVDSSIRRGRQLVNSSESMFSAAEGEKRSRWEANVRRARGRVYSATMDGFRDQFGVLWRPNTRVRVLDDYAGIDGEMLVNSVTYSVSEQGSTSTLAMVERDAYTLAVQEPKEPELGFGLVAEDVPATGAEGDE
jgi:prophage tail gpP-like protein